MFVELNQDLKAVRKLRVCPLYGRFESDGKDLHISAMLPSCVNIAELSIFIGRIKVTLILP